MNVVHKAILRSAKQAVFMPTAAKILDVQVQDDQICIWYLIDTEFNPTNRFFAIIGTGIVINEKRFDYIGTVQKNNYVWHIFEVYP